MALDLAPPKLNSALQLTWRWWGSAGTATQRAAGKAFLLLGLTAFVAGLVWTVTQIQQAQELSAVWQALAPQAEKPQQSHARHGQPTLLGPQVSEQRQALAVATTQINTPWAELFEQLEHSTPARLGLVSVEVDSARAVLRLQAEARSVPELLDHAHGLQHRGPFGRVTLKGQEPNERDPMRPVRLSFELALRPAAESQADPLTEGQRP